MTESEAWDSLAAHLQEKNYTGVLVIADWFQENDKEEVAVYLRWAEKRKYLPEFTAVKVNDAPVTSPCWKCKWDISKGTHTCYEPLPNLARYITNRASDLASNQEWYSD